METRDMKVMFNKAGGNAGKNSYSARVSLPKSWLDKMNITLDEREIEMAFVKNQIIITKK